MKFNTYHKLILFPLVLMFISLLEYQFAQTWIPDFIYYLLPSVIDFNLIIETSLTLLGILIICLSATNIVKRIEIALIPFLILLTYFNFPFYIFLFPSQILWHAPTIVCFGLIFYRAYFLLKDALGQNKEISETENKSYKPSDELSEKEFLPTLILCFFVGMLGVHRFYVGKIGTGVAMIFTLGGLGIWVLVDFILICIGSFRDIDGRLVKYQRASLNEQASNTGIAEELRKFAELRDEGIISEEEFNRKKEELL